MKPTGQIHPWSKSGLTGSDISAECLYTWPEGNDIRRVFGEAWSSVSWKTVSPHLTAIRTRSWTTASATNLWNVNVSSTHAHVLLLIRTNAGLCFSASKGTYVLFMYEETEVTRYPLWGKKWSNWMKTLIHLQFFSHIVTYRAKRRQDFTTLHHLSIVIRP